MKAVRTLLFTVYTIFVVLLLGFLCFLFFMSSQMKKDGVFTMMGYRFSVMDTNQYQSKIPKGFMVTTKIVKTSDIKEGNAVTYKSVDAQQKTHVTCGEVSAIDAVASPASYMIRQDNAVYSEIVDANAILGMPTSKSLFLGGTFTFLMTDLGFYVGFILPVGVLLISEVVLLILILLGRKKRGVVQPESQAFRRADNFNVRVKSQEPEDIAGGQQTMREPLPVKPRVVPADQVLPKKFPAADKPVKPAEAHRPEPIPQPKPENQPAPEMQEPQAQQADQGEELSSVLASLMEREEPAADTKHKAAEKPDDKDLMDESSADIINDILKKLYADEQ